MACFTLSYFKLTGDETYPGVGAYFYSFHDGNFLLIPNLIF